VQGRFDHHRLLRWKRRQRHRNLVVGGGPIGGNKYPFLAIVSWPTTIHGTGEPTGDPRARAWLWSPCTPVRLLQSASHIFRVVALRFHQVFLLGTSKSIVTAS
jgi:hypothetical protein